MTKNKIPRFVFLIFGIMLFYPFIDQAQDTNKLKIEYTNLEILQDNYVKKLDTNLNNFQHYIPLYTSDNPEQLNYFYTNTGNEGSPAFRLVFYPEKYTAFDPALHQFDIYSLKKDDVLYYDTWTPYTRFYYVQGPKEFQIFNVTHVRNINPYWNIAIDYKNLLSDGFYYNQIIKENYLTLTSRFRTKNGRYKVYISGIRNSYKCDENGGIKNDSVFENYSAADKVLSTVKLNNASQKYYENIFSLSQILNLTKRDTDKVVKRFGSDLISLQHQISYKKTGYNYNSDLSIDTGYYRSIIIDSSQTKDYLNTAVLTNILSLNIKSKNFKNALNPGTFFYKISYGFLYENGKISQDTLNYNYYDLGTFLKSSTGYKNFALLLDMFYHISGKTAGDYDLSEAVSYSLKKFQLIAGIRQLKESPTLIQDQIYSNHLSWKNDFIPWQDMNFFVKLLYCKFIINLNYHLIQNYIYFNSDCQPAQAQNNIKYISAELQKTFRFGHFSFVNKAIYQYTQNNDYIRYPDWIYFSSFYYENRLFQKNLKIQVGFDFRYTDSYRSYSYFAPFSILYSGNDNNLPESYVVDIFINANVKRLNFFLKYENLNEGVPSDYNYLLPHYPSDPREFRFGVAWMFFD